MGIVSQIKYLGVATDHKLDSKDNTNNVGKKVAKNIGVLSRLASSLTVAARKSVRTAVIAANTLTTVQHCYFYGTMLALVSYKNCTVEQCEQYWHRPSETTHSHREWKCFRL